MKEILLNPILLLLYLIIFIIFYIILVRFVDRLLNQKSTSKTVEKVFTVILFFIITGFSLTPLTFLNPFSLASGTIKSNDITFIAQIFFFPLFAFLLRSRIIYLYRSTGHLLRNPFLSGLLLLTVLSALWSETPFVTLKASLILLGYAVIASSVAYRYDFQEIGEILLAIGTFITVPGVLAAILIPSVGKMHSPEPELEGAWQGLLDHKNTFGFWMALTASLWFLKAINQPKSRWQSIGLGSISIFALIGSRSGSSKLMLFLMICILILSESLKRLKRLNIQKVAVIAIFISTLLGLFAVILFTNQAVILGVLGKDASLTGRTEFWPQVMQAVWRKPLFGYGYGGFWQSWRGYENPARTIITAGEFVPPHAHNGYLEILLATGFVGMTLFSLALLLIFIKAIMLTLKSRRGEAETAIIMLIFLLLSNFSESKLWFINEYTFIFFLASTRLNINVISKSIKGSDFIRSQYPGLTLYND